MLVHACDAASVCGVHPDAAVPLFSLLEASTAASGTASTSVLGGTSSTVSGTSGITCLLVDEQEAGDATVPPKHFELLVVAGRSDLHGGLGIGIMA